MRNRKYMTPLFLAASFLLVGCSSDTIVARPTWKDESIIVDSNGIKDNKLKSIYDAVKSLGDTNSAVLNRVMYDIAKTHIGDYYKIQEYVNSGEETAIIDSKFINFIKEHNIYQSSDKGAKMTDKTTGAIEIVSFDDDHKLRIAYRNLKARYDQIVEDIAEKLYNEIKGGSYNDSVDKEFHEEYFVQHLKKELYEVGTSTDYTKSAPVLPKKAQDEKYSTIIGNYLSTTIVDEKEGARYYDYIDRKILPELYKQYLTESYVAQQRYSSLGRSYARKVNMITIPASSDVLSANIDSMLQWYAKNYITGADEKEVKAIDNSCTLETINTAMIGLDLGAPTLSGAEPDNIYHKLLNYTIQNTEEGKEKSDWTLRTNFQRILNPSDKSTPIKYHSRTDENGRLRDEPFGTDKNVTYVYKGTKLGDMVEKLLSFADYSYDSTANKDTFTAREPRTDAEEKAYLEFTNNHAQGLDESIILKEQEIRAADFTKDGWYLKNGGLTDLDSEFRDHLFDISTSNVIDDYNKITGSSSSGYGEYVRYFGEVKKDGETITDISNRKAYLTTGSSKLWQTVVLHGKSNYFMVEVQEAPNTSKLSSIKNNKSYLRSKTYVKPDETISESPEYISTRVNNEIVSNVVKANSNSDTYKKNANEYYLMISNIVFYDQSVYDYFKSQFPDLFK